MENFCHNHPEEKAVGTCGGCGAFTCYRCSMNVDQVVYCSLECFNQLNPPSQVAIPRVEAAPTDNSEIVRAALQDEYSDVMQAMTTPAAPTPAPAAAPAASLEDPSVILSAAHAEEPSSVMLKKYRNPATGEDSTLVLIPGTRRSVLSSSCFFHPDTSAIVLCAECRNPICSLCARETAGGLACSPSCGPADPAREIDRKNSFLFSLALAGGVLVALVGGILILRSAPLTQLRGAVPAPSIAEASPDADRPRPAVAPVPAAAPEPAPTEPAPAASPLDPPSAPSARVVFRPVLPPRPPPVALPEPDPEPALPAPVLSVAVRTAPPEPVRPLAAPPVRRTPEAVKLSPYDLDLGWAAALLRDSMPLVREVCDELGPDRKPDTDVPALAKKLTRAVIQLRQARELLARRVAESPDRAQLEDRITAIGDTLQLAQDGFKRMGGIPQWRH
jgi:hypothetical protein